MIDKLIDLCEAGKNVSKEKQVQSIEMQVRTINPSNIYEPKTDDWLSPKWVTIGKCSWIQEKPRWEWKEPPPVNQNSRISDP
ncbi:MAG: hypothetical protein ABEH43_06905 [Flavobacteriales bacterium]